MTSSAHGATGQWDGDAGAADLAAEGPEPDYRSAVWEQLDPDLAGVTSSGEWDVDPDDWEHVTETASDGLSTRALIATSMSVVTGAALLNLALTGGEITFFFDLCFVIVCLVSSMAVRRTEVFAAGVLPPLVFAAVIATVSLAQPQALATGDGADVAFLTGLADHALGLVGGYSIALLAIAARVAAPAARTR